jgi:hypothetical protein
MNFLLYCCFSDRFRATFKSSFAFLSKYCVHYIEPNYKLTPDNNNHSLSVDNIPFNSPHNPSNYSLNAQGANTRMPHSSNDSKHKCLVRTLSDTSQRQSQLSTPQSWKSSLFSNLKLNKRNKTNFKQTCVWQSSDTVRRFILKKSS